ncbi:S-layer homology domain-containing protein [Bacillus sp. CGMCC 1.16607]|uniref:S-layer homology domain-containing protein n=1 Tax=Bacillus sp. CGMCC 1.16607 TaxID=3351842 RepID=UPI003628AF14
MRKKINLFLTLLLLLAFAPTAYAKDDITGIKLEPEMRAMIERGVMQGVSPGHYDPNNTVTRGQFATFLTRALNLPPGPAVFTDVAATSSLAAGINSANAAGIVTGRTKTTFAPNEVVTREQAADMIDRAMEYKGMERTDADLNFTDAADIDPNFKAAIARNAKDNIIQGLPDGRFLPKKTVSRAEAAAFMERMLKIMEANDTAYKIGTIEDGKLVKVEAPYDSFNTAKAAISNNNQVIMKQGKFVYMKEGLVRSNASAITLYAAENFSKSDKNLSLDGNQEMKYLDATDQYVKVQIANTTAYAKPNEVTLVPIQLVDGRNYYKNEAGELNHYVYKPASKNYDVYPIGKAPSFLTQGEVYHSLDGVEFFNKAGKSVGKAYQYFNYLSARSTTTYSADDLNKYINQRLIEVENKYKENPTANARYKDATKRSKIYGLGTSVKEAETQYGINALLILSIAMHESDYGMSQNAQQKNNLFGLSAVDYNPGQAQTFTTVEKSIEALATNFLNKNYIEPQSGYYYGAILGNKSAGFNVKYASDPFWGQKIAGHMYRVDKFLGGKEIGKYRIFETKVESVNVRVNVGTNSTLQFEYNNAGSPVTIKATVKHSDGYDWYEVVSDVKKFEKAYIRSDVLTELTVAK